MYVPRFFMRLKAGVLRYTKEQKKRVGWAKADARKIPESKKQYFHTFSIKMSREKNFLDPVNRDFVELVTS